MKELKIFGVFLLVILVILTALMGVLALNTTTASGDRSAMIGMWQEVSWYSIPSQSVPHGDDSTIQWQDKGMEAHIRHLLRKPEGEIRKSEVWDIQVLDLQISHHTAHDTMFTALPEGWTAFTYAGVTGTTCFWEYYEGKAFPPIENLNDLVHFESLQILSIHLKPEETPLSDLSGLALRPNLKVVQLTNCAPDSLVPLTNLKELNHLTLDSCGSIDLTALADLPQLSALSLRQTSVNSLEPLATLPRLSYLDLGCCLAYPSMEPLTRSNVAYLSLDAPTEEPIPKIADLHTIARIPGLTGLNLSYRPDADTALCTEILARCENLRYLDIYDTPAAAQAEQLDSSALAAFVYE